MAEAQPLNKLVLISDALLVSMASQDRFLKEFPFLRGLRTQAKPAKSCCGTANKVVSETYAAAKRTFAGLGSAKKQKLNEMLNAKQSRIIYSDHAGRAIQLTF